MGEHRQAAIITTIGVIAAALIASAVPALMNRWNTPPGKQKPTHGDERIVLHIRVGDPTAGSEEATRRLRLSGFDVTGPRPVNPALAPSGQTHVLYFFESDRTLAEKVVAVLRESRVEAELSDRIQYARAELKKVNGKRPRPNTVEVWFVCGRAGC